MSYSATWFVFVLNFFAVFSNSTDEDPPLLHYPGDLNIGLLINLRSTEDGSRCSSRINPAALQRAMAAVWSVYQINLRKKSTNSLDFGLYIYDTCSDAQVAQRQTVRLLSNAEDVPANSCQNDNRNPLIGVVSPNKAIDATLNILRLFDVPVILTEEPLTSLTGDPGNVFTVAPSLKYLSKAVISLTKRLKWVYSSMVISDDIPISLSNIFLDLTKTLQETLTPKTLKSGVYEAGKNSTSTDETREQSEIKKNTIFFLSSHEAFRLVQSLQRSKSYSASSEEEAYNWIVITSADISEKIRTLQLQRKACHTKPMFFFFPRIEPTGEFQQFLEQELLKRGTMSQHPLVREFAKAGNNKSKQQQQQQQQQAQQQLITRNAASIAKAVWTLASGARKLEQRFCPSYISRAKCNGKLRGKLAKAMAAEIRVLSETLGENGLEALESFRLAFDQDQILKTNKYTLAVLTHDCRLLDAGYYDYASDLVINEQIFDKIPEMKANTQTGHAANFESQNDVNHKADRNSTAQHEDVRTQKRLFKSSSEIDQTISLIESLPSPSNTRIEQRSTSPETTKSVTRKQERRIKGTAERTSGQYEDVVRVKHTSFTTWLGPTWALGIIGGSIIGALISLYFFIFLLMKACEGAFKKSNQDLVTTHLIAIVSVFFAAALYVFQPTPFMCSIRTSVHNISLTLLFGSLLQRAMHLRSQKWIGLGGKLSQLNQCLTLCFIIGVQLALEVQRWRYEKPPMVAELTVLPNLCSLESNDFVYTQFYLIVILSLLVMISWTARSQPFTFKEGQHLFLTTLVILPIYATATLVISNFNYLIEVDEPDSTNGSKGALRLAKYRDILISLSMLSISIVSLLGIFGPIVYTIHKYGVLPRKNGSYAESLSTAFTLFNGSAGVNEMRTFEAYPSFDSCAHRVDLFSKTGRNKPIKTPESAQVLNYVLNSSQKPNFKMEQRHSPLQDCCLREHATAQPHISELFRNPLYDDNNGFRSAYP